MTPHLAPYPPGKSRSISFGATVAELSMFCFAQTEVTLSVRLRLFYSALSLLTGCVPATAPWENSLANQGMIWLCHCHRLVYLCLSASESLSLPYISLMGLFGYLHKCSPSALIVVLWESFFLSVMSCSRAMKSQKDALRPCSS